MLKFLQNLDSGAGAGDSTGNTTEGSSAVLSGTALTGGPSPQGATGSTVPEWVSGLPEDLKSAPSLAVHKDLPSFVKSALEAEKMIGRKGIQVPGAEATPEEKQSFYKQLGRPDTADAYQLKIPEEITKNGVPINVEYPNIAQKMFHDAGLTPEQANIIWKGWTDTVHGEFQNASQQSQKDIETALGSLKTEWGEEGYKANLETANMAVREFGGESLIKMLEDTGLGNNPELIKAFAKAGATLREDTITTGSTKGSIRTKEQATAEIERLSKDTEFMALLTSQDKTKVDQREEAYKKFEDLHKLAYPSFV